MKIIEALNMERFPLIVSLLGGGGKSTTMYALAKELRKKGKKVLVTTTTNIMLPKKLEVEDFIIEFQWEEALKRLKDSFKAHSIVGLASEKVGEDKVKGVSGQWINRFRSELNVDVIIVEADGAKGKAFKAPGENEPVIPKKSDICIIVLGIEVLEKPIQEEYMFRPEEILKLLGLDQKENAILTKENISKVILSKEGLLKNVPKESDVVVLINKAEDQINKAVDLGEYILENKTAENIKVLIGQVKNEANPIIKKLGD